MYQGQATSTPTTSSTATPIHRSRLRAAGLTFCGAGTVPALPAAASGAPGWLNTAQSIAARTSSPNGMSAVIFVPIAQPLISPHTTSQPIVDSEGSTRRLGDTEGEW